MPGKRKAKEEEKGVPSPAPDKKQKKKTKASSPSPKGKSKKEAIVVEDEPENELFGDDETDECSIVLDDSPTEAELKFQEELDELTKNNPGNTVFLIESWDEVQIDPEIHPTIEDLRKLDKILLPEIFSEYNESIYQHLDNVVDGLIILNTTSSHIMHGFFSRELDKFAKMWKSDTDKRKEAFSYLFAVTVIAKEMDYWNLDYEDVKAINSLMNKFHTRWKDAFEVTDEELGLKGEGARAKVMKYLIKFANIVQENSQNFDDKPKFHWFK